MKALMKISLLQVLIYMLTSCDGFNSAPDPPEPIEAKIIQVDVEPNPVQVGDTVTFICVLEDSLAENLFFIWGIPNMQNSIATTINEYAFITNLEPGEYGASVSVDDTLNDGITPNKFFEFQVVE